MMVGLEFQLLPLNLNYPKMYPFSKVRSG